MIKNLSKREKALLYILLLVMIAAGGYYLLIMPTVHYYDARAAQLAELQLEQAEMSRGIAEKTELERQTAELRAQMAQYRRQLHPLLVNDELDHLLTGLLLSYRLQPLSLAMLDPARERILPFGEAITSLQEAANQEAGGAGAETEPGAPVLLVSHVDIVCAGKLSDLLRLVDKLEQDDSLALTFLQAELDRTAALDATALTMTTAPLAVSYGAADPGLSYQYSLQVAVYMMEQASASGD